MGIEVKSGEAHRLITVLKEAGFEVKSLNDYGSKVKVGVVLEEDDDE